MLQNLQVAHTSELHKKSYCETCLPNLQECLSAPVCHHLSEGVGAVWTAGIHLHHLSYAEDRPGKDSQKVKKYWSFGKGTAAHPRLGSMKHITDWNGSPKSSWLGCAWYGGAAQTQWLCFQTLTRSPVRRSSVWRPAPSSAQVPYAGCCWSPKHHTSLAQRR